MRGNPNGIDTDQKGLARSERVSVHLRPQPAAVSSAGE